MSQAVKRACDACHRRKVKCDGVAQCRNCTLAQLTCTYNAVPQKKGPKGSRAKVISELRETQRQTSIFAKIQSRMKGGPAASMPVPGSGPTPGLLTPDIIKDCLEFYFTHIYSTIPILDRAAIDFHALMMEKQRDTYCLTVAVCAFVMLQPGMPMPAGDPFNLNMIPGSNLVASALLLEECLRVRSSYDYLDRPSLHTIATNYFIFCSMYGTQSHERAWFYLREAATLMVMSGMDKGESYVHWQPAEASRRRRLYWLVLATERAYALQKNRPTTLEASIALPSPADDPSDTLGQSLMEFVETVRVFQCFNHSFIALWNQRAAEMPSSTIHNLQKELNSLLPSYLAQDTRFTDISHNQSWLKTTSWQVSSKSSNNSLAIQYSLDLGRELLVALASQFPNHASDTSSGFIENLLEVASATTSALENKPASRDPFTMGPREHLSQLHNVISLVRNGDYHFLPLVFHKLCDMLPRLVNPMLPHAPDNIAMDLGSMDIFDGFGNPGSIPPLPPGQLPLPGDTSVFDRKFSISPLSYEEAKYNAIVPDMTTGVASHHHPTSSAPSHVSMSISHPGAPSAPSSATTTTTTPPATLASPPSSSASSMIVSPTVEYRSGMDDFAYGSLSDMSTSFGLNEQAQKQALQLHISRQQQQQQHMPQYMQQQQQQQQRSQSMMVPHNSCFSPNDMDASMMFNTSFSAAGGVVPQQTVLAQQRSTPFAMPMTQPSPLSQSQPQPQPQQQRRFQVAQTMAKDMGELQALPASQAETLQMMASVGSITFGSLR